MKYNIAIDMGSANTVILKNEVGVALVEPTLVLLDESIKKNSDIAFGEDALKEYSQAKDTFKLVSPIKNGVIENKDLAKNMLKHFLDKLNEKTFFKGNLVWLLPASISQNEKNEFVNLGYSLGYKNVDVLPSSIAALQQLEVEYNNPYSHLLVDMGSGVTDVSVVYKGKVVQGCLVNIGGDAVDQGIRNYIIDNYNVCLSNKACEEIKTYLSSIVPNDIISYALTGARAGDYSNNELNISAQEIRNIYTDFYDRVAGAINSVLKMCNNQIIKDVQKTGIYLCGGMSKTLGLDKYLRSKLGINVYIDENPETTVIFGMEKLFNEPQKLEYLIDLNN